MTPAERLEEHELCPNCMGAGYVITCCDDLCATSDHCIHGDGEAMCEECDGEGYVDKGPTP